ncbi:MAG TPA: cytochrome c3 family protein, partial [Anaeromyxobacteraceae bacterium]|nr:cytochrome c3 family protein [Anaeromyxobacteraceae bacterium]
PGPIKAVTETQVCLFCHLTHTGAAKLGNRPDSHPAKYRQYTSSTMTARAPPGPSQGTRMCLSCHDGTIAVGQTQLSGEIRMRGESRIVAGSSSNLGTDLRRSHPVGIRQGAHPSLRRPPPGDAVHMDASGAVECTSCHDPHRENGDPIAKKFLVKTNRDSALCASCHALPLWETSAASHRVSQRPYGRAQGAPTAYGTVGENGCLACHQSHGGSDRGRLLKTGAAGNEDDACLRCHDGRVASTDVASDVRKPYAHATPGGGPSGHDQAEGPMAATRLPETSAAAARHVACVDCHNPHAAQRQPAKAPFASGALAGVWGIDRNGNRVDPVRYEYEVCFKCHGDSANQPQARGPGGSDALRRAFTEVNLRRAFDPGAASFHPVEAAGRGTDVPSLIAPLTVASVVSCSDCHASDRAQAGAPRGPHGSSFPHLLERNYTTRDRTAESPQAYALCYKCHDRDVLLNDGKQPGARATSAFWLHRRHVADQQAPCSACHNSHGVSSLAGNPTSNAHLVDFDVSIVQPNAERQRQYTSGGGRSGGCALSCHGVDHTVTGKLQQGGVEGNYTALPSVASRALRAAKPQLHRASAAPPRR